MGAILQRIFNFIAKFKKLSLILSSIFLFSYVYNNFLELWLQVLIYHIMFIINWYLSFAGVLWTVFSFLFFLYILPDLLTILKKIFNLIFKY